MQRAGGSWTGHEDSVHGLIARAQTAIEVRQDRLGHHGAEKLASLLSYKPTARGWYEVRTEEDVRRSAELIIAATNPHYESAFLQVLRDPMAFRSGFGVLRWSPEEQAAFRDVEICRTALFESASGAYLLPLVLDDTIMLINAGSANPWRRICKTVQTTSNTWNGATSAGTTAHWYAEGALPPMTRRR